MGYNPEQIDNLYRHKGEVVSELGAIQERLLIAGRNFEPEVREHIDHGAARRIDTLIHSVDRVFSIFPPESTKPLDRSAGQDVTGHLHAFLINLCGVFDNWAWAFVRRHGLMKQIGDRRRIGLFNPKTARYLPEELRSFLGSQRIADWQRDYLTNYRDALAHRIPPFVPPMQVRDGNRWSQLCEEAGVAIKAQEWDRLVRLEAEREQLESPCFLFALSVSDTDSMPVWFHAQMVADGRTAAAIGERFLDHWHQKVDPQKTDSHANGGAERAAENEA